MLSTLFKLLQTFKGVIMSIKNSCTDLISKLESCADHCQKFLNNTYPKTHCIQPAKDASAAGVSFVAACKQHASSCSKPECKQACQSCIPVVEKAIEKSNACALACDGAGSDQDCKIVCQDCLRACKTASQACKGLVSKFCS